MPRPKGFTLLAAVLAVALPAQLLALLARRPAGSGQPAEEMVLELLVAALTAVTVEALWRVRPWAARAFGALSALAMLLLALRFDGAGPPEVVMARMANVMMLGVALVFAVAYVHRTLQYLFPGVLPGHARPVARAAPPWVPW